MRRALIQAVILLTSLGAPALTLGWDGGGGGHGDWGSDPCTLYINWNSSYPLRLDGLSLNKTDDPDVPLVLGMTMHRNGNRSVYGDITVFFTDPKGEELVIGKARGVAIYTPNPLRHVRMKLTPHPAWCSAMARCGCCSRRMVAPSRPREASESNKPVHQRAWRPGTQREC